MQQLATIGYEGATLADLIETLRSARVKMLLDVRELPLSRRKGFSKTALTLALNQAGISYVHLKALGDPKEGRLAARAGRFMEFRRIFLAHLKTTRAQEALGEVSATIADRRSCLLCYERDPNQCHRTIIAEMLAQRTSLQVVHLDVRPSTAKSRSAKVRHRAIAGIGQSVTAAE